MKQVRSTDSYQEKFSQLDRNMRWEIADLLRQQNLAVVNQQSAPAGPVPSTFYTRHGKRMLDVAVSAAALVVTLPLNSAIGIVTAATLGRPIFFTQERLGRDAQPFTLVKFRNMKVGFDKNGHPLPGHLRTTRLGKILRKTSLDELLNFWSVLKGDMSIIGPRPLVPEYGPRYSDRHQARHAVRPGLECPPLTPYTGGYSHHDQFENDVWYVENVSWRTDVRLFVQLIRSALDRRQSETRAQSTRGAFLGYRPDGTTVDSHSVPEWALHEVLRRHGLLIDDVKTQDRSALVGE